MSSIANKYVHSHLRMFAKVLKISMTLNALRHWCHTKVGYEMKAKHRKIYLLIQRILDRNCDTIVTCSIFKEQRWIKSIGILSNAYAKYFEIMWELMCIL